MVQYQVFLVNSRYCSTSQYSVITLQKRYCQRLIIYATKVEQYMRIAIFAKTVLAVTPVWTYKSEVHVYILRSINMNIIELVVFVYKDKNSVGSFCIQR